MRTRRDIVRLFHFAAMVAIVSTIGAAAAYLMAAAPSTSEASRGPEQIPAPPIAIQSARAAPRYVGAGSCAARACHGNPNLTPGQEWNSSYAVWIENDPHARAYNVLFTPESKQMAAALNLGDPWKAERCLACHSMPASGSRSAAALGEASTLLADGVSCELCHGAAENYLVAHTLRDWLPKVKSDPRFGMTNTADIAVRAQVCANCHVGQPGPDGRPWRDVNHDLIAAGHPRLSFELSAFMATIPPHWNVQKNPQRFDELHSWLEGQFTSAGAALRVLEARAKAAAAKPDPNFAWPEFAEYDCFACHHALNSPSWRQSLSSGAQHQAGVPQWGSWYYDGLQALDASTPLPVSQRKELLERLHSLGDPLESLIAGDRKSDTKAAATPTRVAQSVATKVPDALAQLEVCRTAWLPGQDPKLMATKLPELRRDLVNSLWNRFQLHEPVNWDDYVQYYLALVAIDRSVAAAAPKTPATSVSGGPAARVLNEIRFKLSFPETDKPAAFSSNQPSSQETSPILRVLRPGFNSPANFDPKAAGLPELYRRAFQQLSTASTLQ